MTKSRHAKNQYLTQWGQLVLNAAHQGVFGQPMTHISARGIAGPRAGAIEISAGLYTGNLLKTMRKNDGAMLRQFIPWEFIGDPVAFMHGKRCRLEAGWTGEMAEKMVKLSDLNQHPYDDGRWVVGKNEMGRTVIACLNDKTPHYLVSGETGSGKSVGAQCATLQLAQDLQNQVVLIDGKYGESLSELGHLPAVVGPIAVEMEDAKAALGWVCMRMRERYEQDQIGRLIVIFDEFQEMVEDSIVVSLLRKIAAQGRGAGVHLIACTQHPTVASFGDNTTRRNLVGKLALRVGDWDASRVAVGAKSPRADYLLGEGDSYVVAPGNVHRTQGAYVDTGDFEKAPSGEWIFNHWPEFNSEDVGQDLPVKREPQYTSTELAFALLAGVTGEGRPTFRKRFEDAMPGADRARRLLALGRSTWDIVRQSKEIVAFCNADCLTGNGIHTPNNQKGGGKWRKGA